MSIAHAITPRDVYIAHLKTARDLQVYSSFLTHTTVAAMSAVVAVAALSSPVSARLTPPPTAVQARAVSAWTSLLLECDPPPL